MRWTWISVVLLLLAVPARPGSFRWTQEGPEGGEAQRFYMSPQRKELWVIAQSLLYRNAAGTGLWQLVPLDLAGDFANDLAFDPTNDQKMYVATDFGRVLRSVDGGKTFKGETLIPGIEVFGVAVDPDNPNIVLASVLARGSGGVFRSMDAGKTWNRVGLQGQSTNLLYVDPEQPGHVYATSGGADGGQLFLSKDGGLSFAFLGVHGAEGDPRDIDYGSTVERKNVFYAAVRSGVVKSVDGGRRWFQTTMDQSATGILRTGGLLLASTQHGLYMSRDEANTWELRGDEERPQFLQRMGDLALRGQDLYVAAARSGIVKSRDLGASYEDYNRGFLGHRLLSMDVDATRGHVVVAGQSGAGVFRRDAGDHFRRWAPVGQALKLPDPSVIAILDRKNPRKIYAGVRVLSGFGVSRTEDGGQTWTDMGLNLPGLPLTLGIHPAQEGPDKLVAGTTDGTFQFRQDLSAWIGLFPGIGGSPQTLAFDPQKPDRIYLGTTLSLYRSDDGGQTYTDLTGPLRTVCRLAPQELPELCVGDPNTLPMRVIDIEVDPSDPDQIFVSFFRGGVWTSTAGGASLSFYFAFREPGTNRSLEEVTSIAVRPGRPQEQYFGTTVNGVFRVVGNRLEAFSEGLVYPRVQELAFDRKDPQTLYARLLVTGVAAYTFGTIPEIATFVPALEGISKLLAALSVLIVVVWSRRGRGAGRAAALGGPREGEKNRGVQLDREGTARYISSR